MRIIRTKGASLCVVLAGVGERTASRTVGTDA